MYQWLRGQGEGFCLIDHDKLLIMQLDEEALWELLVYERAAIRGLTLEDVNFKERWFGTSHCNWIDGENIFLKANRFMVGDNGRFTIWSKEHPLSGVVDQYDDLVVVLRFDFGMCVPVMREDYDELMSGDVPRIVATLKKLSELPDDCGWLVEDFLSPKDKAHLLETVRKMVAVGRYPLHDKGKEG